MNAIGTLVEGAFAEPAEPEPWPARIGRIRAEGDDPLPEQVPDDVENQIGIVRIQLHGRTMRKRLVSVRIRVLSVKFEGSFLQYFFEFFRSVIAAIEHDAHDNFAKFFVTVLRLVPVHFILPPGNCNSVGRIGGPAGRLRGQPFAGLFSESLAL